MYANLYACQGFFFGSGVACLASVRVDIRVKFDRCQNQQDMRIVVTIVMDMHLTMHIVNIRDPGNCGYARRFDQVRT